jgi:hypothetical protein
MRVAETGQRELALPSSRVLYWAKLEFEWT